MAISRAGRSLAAVTLLSSVMAGCAGVESPATSQARDPAGQPEIPFRVAKSLASGDVRALVEVSVAGGQPQAVLLDTGSAGLRMFADRLPTDGVAVSTQDTAVEFGDGTEAFGPIATAKMKIGSLPTSGAIEFMAIQRSQCAPGASSCRGSDVAKFARSIGADGILGIDLSAGTPYSPLLQLDAVPKVYTIHISGKEGSVVFGTPPIATGPGPTGTAEVSLPAGSPATQANGVPAWNDHAVPLCWKVGDATRTCADTVLDLGAPAMQLPSVFPGVSGKVGAKVPAGTPISAAATATGAPFYQFTTGKQLGTTLAVVAPTAGIVNTGMPIFRDFAVTYDVRQGQLRLAANP